MKTIFFAFLSAFFFFLPISSGVSSFEMPFKPGDAGLHDFSGEDLAVESGSRADGSRQISNFAMEVMYFIRSLLGVLATTIIIFTALQLLFAPQTSEKRETLIQSFLFSSGALLFSFLIEPLVKNIIYGGGKDLQAGEAFIRQEISTASALAEFSGIIGWIKGLIGMVAVIMIIVTGIQALFSSEEDAPEKIKNNLLSIGMGLILLSLNEVLVYTGIYGYAKVNSETNQVEVVQNSFQLISEIGNLTLYFLSFVGLVAFVLIVYGGFLILTAEYSEQENDGKTIIKQTAIGTAIILLSYVLIRTFVMIGFS
jgi:hypothetical protein